jgi:hypothetical protein
MDAETIKREAGEALLDLELDSTVSDVLQSGKNWCIQFAGDYGRFCDTFQNQFERDNSPRVIREKIKKHLLGQITQLRNKGGRKATKKSFDDDKRNVTDLFQDAVTETTRAIGEAIDRTFGFTTAAIKSAGDVAETVTSKTSEMIRPERVTVSRPAQTSKTPARKSPAKKAAGKSARAGSKRKASGKSARAAVKKSAGARKKITRKR